MRVFEDAVKLETERVGKKELVGWFRDEVSALAAAGEWTLLESAILAELRQLPEMVICCEYVRLPCKKRPKKFVRGTRVRIGPLGRKVVRVPGSAGKCWIR